MTKKEQIIDDRSKQVYDLIIHTMSDLGPQVTYHDVRYILFYGADKLHAKNKPARPKGNHINKPA